MSIQYTVLRFEPTTLKHESHPITIKPGLFGETFFSRMPEQTLESLEFFKRQIKT